MVRRIVSGGQTGADRAGLDAANRIGLPHGGWCPKGRRAEGGRIPTRYRLQETESDGYSARTQRNVFDSAATVIFTRGPMTPGSALTEKFADWHGRPCLHVDVADPKAEENLRAWLSGIDGTLNVAGSRESGAPGIGQTVFDLLVRVIPSPPDID